MRLGRRQLLWAIAFVATLVLGAQTVLLASADFAGDKGLWIALDWVIGGGFVGVGLFAWYRRPDNRVGALMVATGFAWFVASGARTEPALLFTAGALLSNLFVGTAIHLLLAFPSGRLAGAADRWIVGIAYAVTTVGFLPVMFTLGSSHESCVGCPENLLLIETDQSFALTALDILSVIGIVVLATVAGRLIGRWRAASPPMRRVITPVFAAGALLLMMLAAVLLADLAGASESFTESAYYTTLIPFGAVPYLFLASLARSRMLRGGAVGELIEGMRGSGHASLRDLLARALGDPSLELAFWLPQSRRYVDSEGAELEPPPPRSGRAVYPVELEGETVALLIHDPLLLDEPELVAAVGAAAALALEKERLDAELRATVAELRASRARIVAVGVSERRRLERDLHDGAQQRLVSLALDLRLARGIVADDPARAVELLDGASEELQRALADLRELARGMYPAVLSDRGLDQAVEALAERAPLPVELTRRLGERVDEAVELAAYYVVSESLTNVVKYSGATAARISVGRENGGVVVAVSDDGVGGADPEAGTGLRGLSDRLAALGGRLEVSSEAGRGTTIVASIPCE